MDCNKWLQDPAATLDGGLQPTCGSGRVCVHVVKHLLVASCVIVTRVEACVW
jgi:hypothetical protein